jgi:hypothetical protein
MSAGPWQLGSAPYVYGGHLLRVVSSVALAMSLLGCYGRSASAPSASSSGSVQLLTVETQTSFGTCVLDAFYVADLIAEPTSGAPIDGATGKSFAWPKGFTARRSGSEVEVLDPAGNIVLMTGHRYRMCPAPDDTNVGSGLFARSSAGAWVIGMVSECMDCALGGYGYPFDLPDCTANPTDAGCKPPGGPSPTPPQPKL